MGLYDELMAGWGAREGENRVKKNLIRKADEVASVRLEADKKWSAGFAPAERSQAKKYPGRRAVLKAPSRLVDQQT